jgi:hypothetical protein
LQKLERQHIPNDKAGQSNTRASYMIAVISIILKV